MLQLPPVSFLRSHRTCLTALFLGSLPSSGEYFRFLNYSCLCAQNDRNPLCSCCHSLGRRLGSAKVLLSFSKAAECNSPPHVQYLSSPGQVRPGCKGPGPSQRKPSLSKSPAKSNQKNLETSLIQIRSRDLETSKTHGIDILERNWILPKISWQLYNETQKAFHLYLAKILRVRLRDNVLSTNTAILESQSIILD